MQQQWDDQTGGGTPLVTRIERMSTQLETISDTHRMLRNWVAGLFVVGVGALIMFGARMQQIDDMKANQQEIMRDVRQLQINYAGRTELAPRESSPWNLSKPASSSSSPTQASR